MRFSIIAPHYDQSISDETFLEGMTSLSKSTFKDFEVRIYHDGPVNRPLPDIDHLGLNYVFKQSKVRYNDWGHTLRDAGIREAKGDYIIHFNPDNLLYYDVLEEVAKFDDDIIICPVELEGTYRLGGIMKRTMDKNDRVLLDGFPAVQKNIDAFQLIMKTSLWIKEGGWYDKSEMSDGLMYQKFCSKYDARYCYKTIGLHR